MKLNEIVQPSNDKIKANLKILGIGEDDYIINKDGTVYLQFNVTIAGIKKKTLGIQFKTARSHFKLMDCPNLTNLKELPRVFERGCELNYMRGLKNLHGFEDVEFKVSLILDRCYELESLEGLPTKMTANLYLTNSHIPTLKGIPEEINGELNISSCDRLLSLDHLPKKINGNFYLESPKIKNLLKIFSVKGIVKFVFSKTFLDSHPETKEINDIINKHYKTGDVIECQEELIEAGFKEYARLK